MQHKRLIAFINSYTQGISGGDVYFFELAKRMDKYHKIVITSQLGKNLCEANGLKADYLLTTREGRFRNVIFTYITRIVNSVFLKLEINEMDILYSSSDFLPDVIPAFFRKLRKKKVKWVQKIFHLIPANRIISNNAQKLSFFLIKQLADLVIADNLSLKVELIQRGFKADKIKVNYPGIDMIYYKNIKITEKKYEAIFLGRFHYSKGIFDLVEIWRLVCKNIPTAKLAIIGGGNRQLKDKLINEIRKAKLENNIILMGYMEKKESIETMKSGKIFVFPSHEEGFGIAILEAMCCGLPVIAWDLPIYREVFQDAIIQIKENNIDLFSKEIVELIKDSDKQTKMSNIGYEYIKKYSWDNAVNRELEIIES